MNALKIDAHEFQFYDILNGIKTAENKSVVANAFQFYDILNGIKTNKNGKSKKEMFQFYDILNGIKTKNNKLVMEFNGIREAERWLIKNNMTKSLNASSIIVKVLKGHTYRKTAYGYVWKYL